jgi:hypothetical protein
MFFIEKALGARREPFSIFHVPAKLLGRRLVQKRTKDRNGGAGMLEGIIEAVFGFAGEMIGAVFEFLWGIVGAVIEFVLELVIGLFEARRKAQEEEDLSKYQE